MFQSLRVNNQVYILHKGDKPYLETGYVTNVSAPKPKYSVPPTFGQLQEMVIDISVKIGTTTYNYNGLSTQLDVADSFSNGESITLSDNKTAMNAEILSLKQKSIDIVNSVELHKGLITNYDSMLSDLNPEFAEKQAQKVEIEDLKQQMNVITKSLNELMISNKQLLEQLK